MKAFQKKREMKPVETTETKKDAVRMFTIYGLCGLIAGIARFGQLKTGFETAAETVGLAVPGNKYALIVTVMYVAVAVSLFVLLLQSRYSASPIIPDYGFRRVGRRAQVLMIFAAFCAFFAASIQLVYAVVGKLSIWDLIASALLFASAATVVATVRAMGGRFFGKDRRPPAVLFSVFWACAYLLDTYQADSGNPTVLKFIFPIAAGVFIVFMMYFSAGYAFGRNTMMPVFLSCCGALFFALENLIGGALFGLSEYGFKGLFKTQESLIGVVMPAFVYLYAILFSVTVVFMLAGAEGRAASLEGNGD